MSECIFCKIIKKEIPASVVYEDDKFLAFEDINPIDKVHILIIPKIHVENLIEANEEEHKELFADMLFLGRNIAKAQGLNGYRTMINSGKEGGQEVFHIHFHIYGGSEKLKKI
jgi:histidine triad (HIT) family protein